MRRFPLAFLLLGLLSVLAAGAAVLGAFQAPTGADLTVHNGAGQTLAANRVAGHYTTSELGTDVIWFVYLAPGKANEVARDAQGTVKARRTVTGSEAVGVLQPIRQLLSITNFTQHGQVYVSTRSVATLVPSSQRSLVSGSYRTTVEVANGFVVDVSLAISATEAGQHLSEHLDYRLTRIGSWEVT